MHSDKYLQLRFFHLHLHFASTILIATANMHSEVTHIRSYNPVFVYANNHFAAANVSSFVSIFISANMHVAVTTLCSNECEIVATAVTESTASGLVVCLIAEVTHGGQCGQPGSRGDHL